MIQILIIRQAAGIQASRYFMWEDFQTNIAAQVTSLKGIDVLLKCVGFSLTYLKAPTYFSELLLISQDLETQKEQKEMSSERAVLYAG